MPSQSVADVDPRKERNARVILLSYKKRSSMDVREVEIVETIEKERETESQLKRAAARE